MRKLLAAVLLAPALAAASGYEVPNVNARDLALVSSAVAAQRDAGATNVNPAALSRLQGLSLNLNGSMLALFTDWEAPEGSLVTGKDSTNLHPVPPVSLFAAYGTKLDGRGVGIGFGMGNPAGGNMFWDNQWEGRGRIITVQRRVYGFYLNGGVEVIPDVLRLGGGGIYYHGTQYLKQGVEPVPGAYAELAVDGGAFAYEVAAELKPFRDVPLTFGVDYKHKGHMDHSGDGNFVVPPGLESPGTADQGVDTQLTVPNLLHVGVAWRPVKPLQLTFGWSLARFVVYKEDLIVGDQGLTIVVPRDYRNGYGFRLGAEYDLSPRWQLRAGLFRDHSGLRTRTYSPSLPDGDAWVGALGAGFAVVPNVQLNGGVYYANRDKVTSTEWRTAANPNGSFPGIYETEALIVSLGVAWTIDLGNP
jgi:long-chain fatty acid transport protein